jgi:hypothetical protein
MNLVEQTNNSNKPTLSDLISSVLLKIKLSYPKEFVGNQRKVYLSGFFEISKILKAFFVYANEIVTKVG